jgi:hypothetical protein
MELTQKLRGSLLSEMLPANNGDDHWIGQLIESD